jgi:AcrR family transcriptional regulator
LVKQKSAENRQADEDRMADHVLMHGLPMATLRPLAAAAGTSDRMLIYRYGTKDALIARLLDIIADRLTALLDAAPPPASTTPDGLAAEMATRLANPVIAPFRAVWLELVATAARGNPAAQQAAARILSHFADWLTKRLPPDTPDKTATAARVLAKIEGGVVFSTAGAEGQLLINQAFDLR